MTRIKDLEEDIVRLNECIKGINEEIEKLQAKKDHVQVAAKVKDLRGVRKLLDESKEELEAEQIRVQNKPSDEQRKKNQAAFDRKSNSYAVVRNSYVKPALD